MARQKITCAVCGSPNHTYTAHTDTDLAKRRLVEHPCIDCGDHRHTAEECRLSKEPVVFVERNDDGSVVLKADRYLSLNGIADTFESLIDNLSLPGFRVRTYKGYCEQLRIIADEFPH
jgi:hypothetical protein